MHVWAYVYVCICEFVCVRAFLLLLESIHVSMNIVNRYMICKHTHTHTHPLWVWYIVYAKILRILNFVIFFSPLLDFYLLFYFILAVPQQYSWRYYINVSFSTLFLIVCCSVFFSPYFSIEFPYLFSPSAALSLSTSHTHAHTYSHPSIYLSI